MKIVSDDRKGIGRISGNFVYVNIDEDGDLDCGIRLVKGGEYGGTSLSEWSLIDTDVNGDIDFHNSIRSPLDEESNHTIAILSKHEVGKMIKSLQKIYDNMD